MGKGSEGCLDNDSNKTGSRNKGWRSEGRCMWLAALRHLCSLLPCHVLFMYWAITQMHISLLFYFLNMITTFTKILFYKVYICIKFSMAFTSPLTSVIDIFFQLTVFIYIHNCQWTFLLIYLSFDRKYHRKFKSLHNGIPWYSEERRSTPCCLIISQWWRTTKDSRTHLI